MILVALKMVLLPIHHENQWYTLLHLQGFSVISWASGNSGIPTSPVKFWARLFACSTAMAVSRPEKIHLVKPANIGTSSEWPEIAGWFRVKGHGVVQWCCFWEFASRPIAAIASKKAFPAAHEGGLHPRGGKTPCRDSHIFMALSSSCVSGFSLMAARPEKKSRCWMMDNPGFGSPRFHDKARILCRHQFGDFVWFTDGLQYLPSRSL